MESLRARLQKLWGETKSEVESEGAPLLSEVIEITNGYIPPQELQILLEYATELQEKKAPADSDKQWLKDFVLNIGLVMQKQQELDMVVGARARGPLEQGASTSSAPQSQAPRQPPPPLPVEPTPGTSQQQSFFNTSRPSFQGPPLSSHFGPVGPMTGALANRQPTCPRIKLNELAHRPEKFEGDKRQAHRWIEDYEAASLANGWQEAEMRAYISAFLAKSAKDWYAAILQPSLTVFTTWTDIKKKFLRYYVGPEEQEAIRDEIRRTRQKQDEPAVEFIARVIRLLRIGYPDQQEREMVREVRLKLRNQYQDRLVGHKLTTIEQLNDLCLEIETRMDLSKQQQQTANKSKPVQHTAGRQNNNKETPTASTKVTRGRGGRRGGAKQDDTKTAKRPLKNPQLQCSHCNKPGHTQDYCWDLHGRPKSNKTAATLQDTEPVGKVTVIKNTCGVIAAIDQPIQNYVHQKVRLSASNDGRSVGRQFMAMVDSGSGLSIIHRDVAMQLGAKPDGATVGVCGADRKALETDGFVTLTLELTIGDTTKRVRYKFAVMPNLCVSVLLGNQLLSLLKTEVNLVSKKLKFANEGKGVRVVHDTIVPARSQMTVESAVPSYVACGTTLLTVPFNFCQNLITANSIDQVNEHNRICVGVVNLDLHDVLLPAGAQIASCEELPSPEVESKFVDDKAEPVRAVMPLGETGEIVRVGDELSEEQVGELQTLLNQHEKAFSIAGSIGETHLVEHDIELEEGAQPIVEPLRRRPLSHREEAERQISRMLEDKIIEHSASPWASAYVIVKKKTGDKRLCIDYRKLNEKTRKNVYPLPNIEDCLEPLSGNAFFSQLDLASGYWQIAMSNRAKALTAFRSESGHYQFRRMPFGLCNAPASFQRLVNALFAGLRGIHLQVFIDDICLATRDWPSHLELIKQVLVILERAKLTLKPGKCTFGARKVIFLGHELSAQGIRQDPDKVKAIVEMAAPNNVAELRRVMGLFNYYRRFVPNFSLISEPITSLTQKRTDWNWGRAQQAAFEQLKAALASDPVLAHFNHKDPLALKTDASRAGVAGILLQRQGDDWHIITCCSRRLSDSETRYGITDLEGLAIVFSVTKLRNYLLGKHFTILTDHCALCALKKKVPHSPRLYRWTLLLSEFEFSIQYIRGGLHQDIDCLSRAPVDDADEHLSDKLLMVRADQPSDRRSAQQCAIVVPFNVREWRESTAEDDEGKQHLAIARKRTKGYKIFNGCLYYEDRLFVPTAKRKEIMSENHDDSLAGHGGIRATLERMSQYWWPNMAGEVRDYVSTCAVCQARKAERKRPAGEMHSFHVREPFELVAIDVLGPLPPSIAGKRHVFVAVDCFTRFVFAAAYEDVQAETAVQFMRQLIGILGMPKGLLTDNAPTFKNNTLDNFLSSMKIDSVDKSTPGHHQGNAMVERCIQTLQDKLALITHDATACTNWEAELPLAVLSINTSTHAITGFSPFELLLGRKHATRSELVFEKHDEYAAYAKTHESMREQNMAAANARQATSQAKSKMRFDNERRAVVFQEGDKVLARKLERRSKLQNRYSGPYQIISRNNDIYQIESCDERKDRLERHVADLKSYQDRSPVTLIFASPASTTTLASTTCQPPTSVIEHCQVMNHSQRAILCLFLLCCPVSALGFVFREAPLVSWLPTRTYVSSGPITYKLLIRLGHPCDVLRQFQLPGAQDEMETAVRQCLAIYREQVSLPLGGLHSSSSGQVAQGNHYKNSPIKHDGYLTVGQGSQQGMSHHNNNQVVPAQHGAPRQPPNTGRQHNGAPLGQVDHQSTGQRPGHQGMPYQGPNQHNHVPPGSTGHSVELHREGRGIGMFCLGSFAMNVIDRIVDQIFTTRTDHDLSEREQELEFGINALNARSNFTQVQLAAFSEATSLTQQLVKHNVDQIREIRYTYPQLAVVTANLVAKIHLLGAHIDNVLLSFRMGRPDMQALYSLFKMDELLDIDPDSIKGSSVFVNSPFPEAIAVEFTANQKSADNSVYQVASFRYWRIADSGPKQLMEYVGPRFVIYNRRNNCVQGINQVNGPYITAQCQLTNAVDHRLGKWKPVPADESDVLAHQTDIIEAWPNVLTYCYPQSITIEGAKRQCPVFPIELPANTPWSTPTYDYSPAVVEFKTVETATMVQALIETVHFPNATGIPSKDQALQRIDHLQEKLKVLEETAIAFPLAKQPITYQHVSHALGATNLCTIALLIYFLFSWSRNYVHQAVLADIKRKADDKERAYRQYLSQTYSAPRPRRAPATRESLPMITFPISD